MTDFSFFASVASKERDLKSRSIREALHYSLLFFLKGGNTGCFIGFILSIKFFLLYSGSLLTSISQLDLFCFQFAAFPKVRSHNLDLPVCRLCTSFRIERSGGVFCNWLPSLGHPLLFGTLSFTAKACAVSTAKRTGVMVLTNFQAHVLIYLY